MPTGYEVQMYADIAGIRRELNNQSEALVLIAQSLVALTQATHEGLERIANILEDKEAQS